MKWVFIQNIFIYLVFVLQEIARQFFTYASAAEEGVLTHELVSLMKILWADPGVQKCFARYAWIYVRQKQ